MMRRLRQWGACGALLALTGCFSSGAHVDISHVNDVSGAGGLPGAPEQTVISANGAASNAQVLTSPQYRVYSTNSNAVAASIMQSTRYRVTDPVLEGAIDAEQQR